MRALLVLPLLVVMLGCSSRGWYEGMRNSQRSECLSLPAGQQEQCLEDLRSVDYDRYQREREKIRQSDSQ